MKKTMMLVGVLPLILLSTGCAKTYLGNIKTNVAANSEIEFTPELKQLLQDIPKPKIVIRVANPSTNVTEADKFNSYINEIEKMFVKSGYTVRDRALLENLMRGGNADYQGIKDKIDTDLIIDILALNFDGSTKARTFFNSTTRQKEPFLTERTYVECSIATLECRVTIIDRGQLGGLFTLKTSPCDKKIPDFYVDGSRSYLTWVGREKEGMVPVLRYLINTDEEKRSFTQALAKQLIDLLSSH